MPVSIDSHGISIFELFCFLPLPLQESCINGSAHPNWVFRRQPETTTGVARYDLGQPDYGSAKSRQSVIAQFKRRLKAVCVSLHLDEERIRQSTDEVGFRKHIWNSSQTFDGDRTPPPAPSLLQRSIHWAFEARLFARYDQMGEGAEFIDLQWASAPRMVFPLGGAVGAAGQDTLHQRLAHGLLCADQNVDGASLQAVLYLRTWRHECEPDSSLPFPQDGLGQAAPSITAA